MNKLRKLFEKHKIIKTGHFELTSGKHSDLYVNKDAIYSNPALFKTVVSAIKDNIKSYKKEFDIITGPAIAGAILAAPLAIQLNKIFVYPEKATKTEFKGYPINCIVEHNIMKFNRGYDKILQDKKVWIVEDIITTGGSIEKTVKAIVECGGEIAGISAIWNRGIFLDMKNIPFISLINEMIPSYWSNQCPLCEQGIQLQNPKE